MAQIEAAIDRGDLEALSALVATSAVGAALLADAMARVAAEAAEDASDNARSQGVAVEPVEPERDEINLFAAAVAGLLADGMATAAGREALRLQTPGRTGAQVAGDVEQMLVDLPDRPLIDNLGGALWAANGAGHHATLAEASPPPDYFVANEVRDGNTCKRCKDIDGTLFVTIQDALEEYPNGGYRYCYGGIRCRGRYEPVWGEIPQDLLEQTTPKVPEDAKAFHRDLEDIESIAATRLAIEHADRRRQVEWKTLAGGQSADTAVAVLPDGRRLVRKKAPTWGDPADNVAQADAEQLGALTARALDVKVPRVYRDEKDAVWQEFVRGKTVGQLEDEGGFDLEARLRSKAGQRLGLLDMLAGNRERNSGNHMIDDVDDYVGIDHGSAWLGPQLGEAPDARFGETRSRPVGNYIDDDKFIDNPLHPDDVPEVRRRLKALRPDFEKLGRGDWLDWSLKMLTLLGKRASGEDRLYG